MSLKNTTFIINNIKTELNFNNLYLVAAKQINIYLKPILIKIWSFLEEIDFNFTLTIFFISLFFYSIYVFLKFFKNIFFNWYYGRLLNSYYIEMFKRYIFYEAVNPRGFLNYKVIFRKKSLTREKTILRESFAITLDTVEANAIYTRISEYIFFLENRYNCKDNDYSVFERLLIRAQIQICLKCLSDFKKFYRTGGFYNNEWIINNNLYSQYLIYWRCCYYFDSFLSNKDFIIYKNLQTFLEIFIKDCLKHLENQNKTLVLVEKILKEKYNLSLYDLNSIDLSEINVNYKIQTFNIIFNDLELYNFYNNSKSKELLPNFQLFLFISKNINQIAENNINLFISENVIINYISITDVAFKRYLYEISKKKEADAFEQFKRLHKFNEYLINLKIFMVKTFISPIYFKCYIPTRDFLYNQIYLKFIINRIEPLLIDYYYMVIYYYTKYIKKPLRLLKKQKAEKFNNYFRIKTNNFSYDNIKNIVKTVWNKRIK